VFSGWGRDYEDFKYKLKDNRSVQFLTGAISKPIIIDMYYAVDLVIDQFKMAAYGTSGLEALSCGTPLLINLDTKGFGVNGWPDPPPVINIKSKDELSLFFKRLMGNQIDLNEIAVETREWSETILNPESICNLICGSFKSSKGANL
jgi:hypothetical protein